MVRVDWCQSKAARMPSTSAAAKARAAIADSPVPPGWPVGGLAGVGADTLLAATWVVPEA